MNKNANNNGQRILAFISVFFLLMLYKSSVWDPYVSKGIKEKQTSSTSTTLNQNSPVTTPQFENQPAENNNSVVDSADTTEASDNEAVPHHPNTPPTELDIERADFFAIKTGEMETKISLLGGRITELLLSDYKAENKKKSPRLNLVSHIEGEGFPLGIKSGNATDLWTQYKIKNGTIRSNELKTLKDPQTTIVLEGKLSDGRGIEKKFIFHKDGYLFDLQVRLSNPSPEASRLVLNWTKHIEDTGGGMFSVRHEGGVVWYNDEKADRIIFPAIKDDGPIGNGKLTTVRWASLNDGHFGTTLISPEELSPASAEKKGNLFAVNLSGRDTSGAFRIFAGPLSYSMLESADYNLKLNVDLGWVHIISAPLLALLNFLFSILGNYGLAIVALTIVVKLTLYPLNTVAFKNMKAMQDIQPEVKRIREQIKDRQQQQVQLMSLYKKRGVNPMGGCLPMLVQFPIFIGLFFALRSAIELRHAPFAFWIQDLSAPENLTIAGIPVPVVVILLTVSMVLQQLTTPSAMDPVQKKVMLFMPVVFGFLFATFPAGLTVYYLANNLISIAQQKSLQSKTPKIARRVTVITCVTLFVISYLLVKLG